MECPKCRSGNAQLCSMAYKQGTSTTTTTSSVVGGSSGYSPGGGFSTGSHSMSIAATSKTYTDFAKQAAPPRAPGWMGKAALTAFATLNVFNPELNLTQKMIVLFVLVPVAYFLYRSIKRFPEYRVERARWNQSWICAACGNIFIPGEGQ